MKHFVIALLLTLGAVTPAFAQLGAVTYTFTAGTTARSAEVNANFQAIHTAALKRNGGGSLTGATTVDGSGTLTFNTGTSLIGASGASISGTWAGTPTFSGDMTFSGNPTFSGFVVFTGTAILDPGALALRDTDSSHLLTIVNDNDLSADRVLSFVTGDADRTLTLQGDAVLVEGTMATIEDGLDQFGDASTLTVSGTLVAGGDIVAGADISIRRDTSDADDDGVITITGGGDSGTSRGAMIQLFGNEHDNTGQINYYVGNASGASHQFYRSNGTLAMAVNGSTGAVAMLTSATVDGSFGIGGTMTAGSSSVQITNSTGNLLASALTGTIASEVQDTITRTGTVTSGTWSGSFGAVSGANLTSLNASNLSSGSVPVARLPTSGTWTLSDLLALTGGAVGIDELTMPGVIDATVSAATDDWEPTGIAGASVIRVTGSGGSWNVTGIAAPAVDFKVLVLTGVASNGISLLNENNGSEAENRILTPGGTPVTISNGSSAILWYDSSSDRWRVFGR